MKEAHISKVYIDKKTYAVRSFILNNTQKKVKYAYNYVFTKINSKSSKENEQYAL